MIVLNGILGQNLIEACDARSVLGDKPPTSRSNMPLRLPKGEEEAEIVNNRNGYFDTLFTAHPMRTKREGDKSRSGTRTVGKRPLGNILHKKVEHGQLKLA